MAVETGMSQETGVQMPICGEKIAFATPEKTWNHMEQKMSIDKDVFSKGAKLIVLLSTKVLSYYWSI